jgi:hypothetical protein
LEQRLAVPRDRFMLGNVMMVDECTAPFIYTSQTDTSADEDCSAAPFLHFVVLISKRSEKILDS